MKKVSLIRDYMAITVGTCVIAVAAYFFMMPNNIITASITGLSFVLSSVLPLSVSALTFILNLVCLLLGFAFVGREFGAKTIYSSLLLPVILLLLEQIVPNTHSLTDNIVIDGICLIICVSLGQALMFNVNASSGGLDIIARILHKYFHMDFGRAVSLLGIIIVLSSVLAYDIRTLIISAVVNYCNGIVLDSYIAGFTKKMRISIVSDKYEDIKKYILEEINRGVTLYPAKGGYSGKEKWDIVTVLTKNEYAQLISYLRRTDGNAFVTVSYVSEVIGSWNPKWKNR